MSFEATTSPRVAQSQIEVDDTFDYIFRLLKNHKQVNTDAELRKLQNKKYANRDLGFFDEREKMIYLDKEVSFEKFKNQSRRFLEHHTDTITYKTNRCVLDRCFSSVHAPYHKIKQCTQVCQRDKNKFASFLSAKMGRLIV